MAERVIIKSSGDLLNMMINCPKCGFQQPQDRFCASCGIDMTLYRPKATPPLRRLMRNWIFQVGLFGFAIAFAVVMVRLQNSESLRARILAIESAPTVRSDGGDPNMNNGSHSAPQAAAASAGADASTGTTASNGADSSASTAPQPTGLGTVNGLVAADSASSGMPSGYADPPAPGATADGFSTGISKTADALVGDSSQSVAARNAPPTNVDVVYAEVQRGLLTEMMSEAKSTNSFGSTWSGVIADPGGRIDSGRTQGSLKVLETSRGHGIKLNAPILFFTGTRDAQSDRNIGITVQINPTSFEDNTATLNLEMTRSLREPAGTKPPISEMTFQQDFNITKDGGAIISGFFPRRTLDDEDTRAYSNSSLLKILTSGPFQSEATEFVIFLKTK